MTEKTTDNPTIDYTHLNTLMEEKGWKASELAQYANIKYDTAYAIVIGRRPNPSAQTLAAIATALGCTTDYLLGRSSNCYPPIEKLPEQVRQLSRIAGRLSDVRQAELVKIAEALEELERAQPVYTITSEAMNGLLEILDSLQSDSESAETYSLLSTLLNSATPSIVDLRTRKNGGQAIQH